MKSKDSCIVFLTPGFAENEKDTTCIPAMLDFFIAWKEINPEKKIVVLAFQYPNRNGWYKWNGIDVYSASGKNKGGIFKLICWIKILWQIFNINLKSKINFFFSFWLVETALIGELASYIFRKKHFVYLFGQDVLPQNPYLPKINLKKPFIIANSDFTAKTFFESTGRNPEAIVPLGLHLKNIPAINPAEIKAFDIMGAGSLSEIKNYSLFIEIISELKKSFPQIKCCLAGDGDEESRLKEKIKKLNLENVIELKGELKREELISLLQQSKIFLHTSSFESFCMARLEALTCGCSVITFDNGYIPQSEKFIVCKTKEEMMEKILFVLNTTNLTDRAEIRTAQQIVIELNKILLTV